MKIDDSPRAAILAHARRSGDIECCGMLVGTDDRILQAVPATNLLASSVAFLIDPADHIAARRQARQSGLEVVGFYHSHPKSPPRPSARDVAEAAYEAAIHVIAGIEEGLMTLRAFSIRGGEVEEVPLEAGKPGTFEL